MRFLIFILMLIFAGSVFAQDSLRTRDRDNFQNKEQKKEQKQVNKQEAKNNRFVDLDGDGINDVAMERFQKMIKGGQNIDGNIENGQGEMNREQNRTQMKSGTGSPLGDPKGSPSKTKQGGENKGSGKK